ncbi:hypothetical protein G4B88_015596, partial [Cannabis sativa]
MSDFGDFRKKINEIDNSLSLSRILALPSHFETQQSRPSYNFERLSTVHRPSFSFVSSTTVGGPPFTTLLFLTFSEAFGKLYGQPKHNINNGGVEQSRSRGGSIHENCIKKAHPTGRTTKPSRLCSSSPSFHQPILAKSVSFRLILLNVGRVLYELWCLARAAGIRYCVLFCDVEKTLCRKWNEERREKGQPSYDDKIFDDLSSRFETPDRRNRWDSPLFELCPHKDGVDKSSTAIIEAVLHLTKKIDSKTRDVKVLQPTIATQTGKFSEANSLYELDRATQEVTSALVEAQSQALGGPLNGVSLGQGLPVVNISRPVGLPELRRLRRTFIKLTGQTSLSGPPPPSDADSAKR